MHEIETVSSADPPQFVVQPRRIVAQLGERSDSLLFICFEQLAAAPRRIYGIENSARLLDGNIPGRSQPQALKQSLAAAVRAFEADGQRQRRARLDEVGRGIQIIEIVANLI